jgi:hypothetical protein
VKRRGWLDGVGEILRAKTGDLRRLAEIAGEDPRTLYIGTSLDGTDLRGQDLQGMLLPELDLKKVRHDADTRIDPPSPVEDLSVPSMARAVILVRERNPARPSDRGWDAALGQGFALFPEEEEDAFREAAAKADGPAFVVIDHPHRRSFADRLKDYGPRVVTIVRRPASLPPLQDEEANAILELKGPTVVVPTPGFIGAGSLTSVSGPVLDAIAIFTSNWRELERQLGGLRPAIFFRARGKAPDPFGDAWSRIFEQVKGADLEVGTGLRLHPYGPPPEGNDFAAVLFPQLEVQGIDPGYNSRQPLRGALLLQYYPRSGFESGEYMETLLRILRRNGWDVPAQTRWPPPTVTLNGRGWQARLEAREPDDGLREVRLGDRELRETEIGDIVEIFAAERFSPEQVVNLAVLKGTLLVNAGDLRNFQPHAPSIWPLLAQQCARLGRTPDTAARTRYLSLILRSALQGEDIGDGDPWPLVEALNDHEFVDNYRLSMAGVLLEEGKMRTRVRLRRSAERGGATLLEFDLLIGEFGPSLRRFRDFDAGLPRDRS